MKRLIHRLRLIASHNRLFEHSEHGAAASKCALYTPIEHLVAKGTKTTHQLTTYILLRRNSIQASK